MSTSTKATARYALGRNSQPYVLSPHIWQAVGTTSAAATRTIPSSFGTSIPNPATDCSSFTSSTWSVWSLFIAPTVLRGRFPEDRYYDHFCSLVRILNLCLQFEISEEDVNEIESGIRDWVVDYEQSVHFFSFLKRRRLTQVMHPDSTTSTSLNDFQHVRSQYTCSSTFLTKSDGWDRVGQHGLSPSRGNAGTFNAASRADETHT